MVILKWISDEEERERTLSDNFQLKKPKKIFDNIPYLLILLLGQLFLGREPG